MKRFAFSAATGLSIALVVACGPSPIVRPVPVDGATCASACARLRELACESVESPGGASCEAVCEHAAANGVDVGVGCFTASRTCAEVASCEAR
jgi:hypothetical protein